MIPSRFELGLILALGVFSVVVALVMLGTAVWFTLWGLIRRGGKH